MIKQFIVKDDEMEFILYRHTITEEKYLSERGILGYLTDDKNLLSFATMENLVKRIPAGTYPMSFTHSPRFSGVLPYKKYYFGYVPLLQVPSRSGIRIHCGNWGVDTTGCVLLGERCGSSAICQSHKAYSRFMTFVEQNKHCKFSLTIVDSEWMKLNYKELKV